MTTALALVLITAGLTLPGYGWARAARWPRPWIGATLLSWISIFLFVVGFDAVGIPLRLSTLGSGLAAEMLLGGLLAWRQGWRPHLGKLVLHKADAVFLLLLPPLLVALWKALAQPLSGADTGFRWEHLAQLMVQQGSLEHYPPHTTSDFMHYFWADGIAPMTSSLYAWAHLAAGSTAESWTAVPVLLQIVLLYQIIHALGTRWGGASGGRLACLAGAACFLLQFAVNIGQETCLTAAGTAGMVFYLLEWDDERLYGKLVAAAVCGAVAASAREYAMLFPALAVSWIWIRRGGLLTGLLFGGLALLPASLWCLHNLAATGNPFYCMNAAGVFPVNPVFNAWMQHMVGEYKQSFSNAEDLSYLLRYLMIGTLPALAGLAGLALQRHRRSDCGLVLLLAAGIIGCWWASIPLTAGGLFYSMRVLSPLLALGAAGAGACLAGVQGHRRLLTGLGLVMGFWILDASARALVVPGNPYNTPLKEWAQSGDFFRSEHLRTIKPFLRAAAHSSPGATLTVSAEALDEYTAEGRTLLPLWSPDLAFLLDKGCGPGEAAPLLRRLGYSHLLMNKLPVVQRFFRDQGIITRIGPGLRPVAENAHYILYELPRPTAPAR